MSYSAETGSPDHRKHLDDNSRRQHGPFSQDRVMFDDACYSGIKIPYVSVTQILLEMGFNHQTLRGSLLCSLGAGSKGVRVVKGEFLHQ